MTLFSQTLRCMEKTATVPAATASSSKTNNENQRLNAQRDLPDQRTSKASQVPVISVEIDESVKKEQVSDTAQRAPAPAAENRNAVQLRVMNALERMGGEEPPLVCRWEKCSQPTLQGSIPREIRDCIDSFKLDKQGRGIVLYGLPGVGKSTYAERIAAETNRPLTRISSSDFQTKWKASGPKRVHELFEQAEKQEAPVILLIEEIDGAANEEFKNSADMVQTCYALLDAMDRVKNNKNIFVILTSNHFDKLPATLKSRLENALMIPLPDWAERLMVLTSLFSAKNIALSLEMSRKLADKTDGRSRRELENFVKRAELQLRLRLLRAGNGTTEAKLLPIDCALAENKLKLESEERRELIRHWITEHTNQGMQSKIEHDVTEAIPEQLERLFLAYINIWWRRCAIQNGAQAFAEIRLIKNNPALEVHDLDPLHTSPEDLLHDLATLHEKFEALLVDPAVFRYIALRHRATHSGFAELLEPADSVLRKLSQQYLRNVRHENFKFTDPISSEGTFLVFLALFIKALECGTQTNAEIRETRGPAAATQSSQGDSHPPAALEKIIHTILNPQSQDLAPAAQSSHGDNPLPAALEKIILKSINTILNAARLQITKRGVSLDPQEHIDLQAAFSSNCDVFNYVAREFVATQLIPFSKSFANINWLLAIRYLRNANFTNECSLQRIDGTVLTKEESKTRVKKLILLIATNFSLHHKQYLKSTVTDETIQQVAEFAANCTSDQLEKIVDTAANYAVKYQETELQGIHLLMGLYEVITEVRMDAGIRKRILAYLLKGYATEECIAGVSGDLAAGAENFTLRQLEDIVKRGWEWVATRPALSEDPIYFFVGLYLVHRDFEEKKVIPMTYRTQSSADVLKLEYKHLQEEMPNGKAYWLNHLEIVAALFYELDLPGIQHIISKKFIYTFADTYSKKEKPNELGIYADYSRISYYGIRCIMKKAKEIAHKRKDSNTVTEDDFSEAAWDYCKFAFGSYAHNAVVSGFLSAAHALGSVPFNYLKRQ